MAATSSVVSVEATIPPARMTPTVPARSTAMDTRLSEALLMLRSSRLVPPEARIPSEAVTVSAIREASRPRVRRICRVLISAVRAQNSRHIPSTSSGAAMASASTGCSTIRVTRLPPIRGTATASGAMPWETQLRTLERSLVVRATVTPREVSCPGVRASPSSVSRSWWT